jgi:hypothetical protein
LRLGIQKIITQELILERSKTANLNHIPNQNMAESQWVKSCSMVAPQKRCFIMFGADLQEGQKPHRG